ncbi:MAG TPA: carboxymuconolactone decarboxylase family protein [Chloroflexota bacterium]|jgi:4-carboxymuconolactone decarboxylase|nr:carboxymuconolactone decarboxylase family protein [Chloroflexota bacterium]
MAADPGASPLYRRGVEVWREVGYKAPYDARALYPALPPGQAEDVTRKLMEFCFGDVWGRPGSAIDYKTRRLVTIAAVAATGRDRQLRAHVAGALAQGITREEITEVLIHLIAYCGFPVGLSGLEIANEVFAATPQAAPPG